jgi:hypothetical protein
VEGFPGYARGKDVGIITRGNGGEGIGLLDSGFGQGGPVKANAGDLPSAEGGTQAPEGPLILVNDGHRMPGIVQRVGQRHAHASAPHDDVMGHLPPRFLKIDREKSQSASIDPPGAANMHRRRGMV